MTRFICRLKSQRHEDVKILHENKAKVFPTYAMCLLSPPCLCFRHLSIPPLPLSHFVVLSTPRAREMSRDRDVALMRADSTTCLFHPALPSFVRSESTRDVTGYFRPFDRHRPAWLSDPYVPRRRWAQPPVERNRNSNATKLYWRDQYYFFSPLYRRDCTGSRPFASEYGSHPYTYWARYNGYGYDQHHPGYYRRYFNPIEDYFG